MEWNDKYRYWLVAPGCAAFDALQAAIEQDKADRESWRDLADRVSERFGLPRLEAFTFHQASGTLGQKPIIDMSIFGNTAEIEAVTKVNPGSWRKPKRADGGYPLRASLSKRGEIFKALEGLAEGVPSYLWGVRGHLAHELGRATNNPRGLDSVFFVPGFAPLKQGESGAILYTNGEMEDWDAALKATGANLVTCYEAMRAYEDAKREPVKSSR